MAPVYNEEENLSELHRRLKEVLSNLCERYEIIFVDDGSRDRSYPILCELRAQDPCVKVIRFFMPHLP